MLQTLTAWALMSPLVPHQVYGAVEMVAHATLHLSISVRHQRMMAGRIVGNTAIVVIVNSSAMLQ